MGYERENPRSGVGGFFNLFDWKAKSRKKLFAIKADLPEHLKQGKRSDASLPTTRLFPTNDNETGIGTSFKNGSDFSCASSVTEEDGCGSRAPSVVARLMGLDSLPTPNFQEPFSTPFFDTRSLNDAPFHRKNYEFYNDHQSMYSGKLLNRAEESKAKRAPGRPIEKFQTEVLPPKSAKSIPLTHHKLLSPIKSPGFIPSNDVAHVMEAAARIIEPGYQAAAKYKSPQIGSSSLPLKVHTLKQKADATQRVSQIGFSSTKVHERTEKLEVPVPDRTSRKAVESNAAKNLRGESITKSWNGSVDVSFDTEDGSSSMKNKGKSISLALQAKVNVQRRESLNLSSSKSEVRPTPIFRSQQNTQKSTLVKAPVLNSSGALKPNSQKQNSIVDRDGSLSKATVSKPQSRKILSRDSSNRNSKVGSRKSSSSGDGDKDTAPYSSARKKRSVNGGLPFSKNSCEDKSLNAKNQKLEKSSPFNEGSYNWTEESRRKGMDVVSFTFTSPLTRSQPFESQGKRSLVDSDGLKLPSFTNNAIGGDALSILLEETLRELTSGLSDSAKVGSGSSSMSNLENCIPSFDAFSATKERRRYDFEFSTPGSSESRSTKPFEVFTEMDESINTHFKTGNFLSCRHPSPVSILEPSFSIESSDYSASTGSNSLEGSKLSSSVKPQEVNNTLSFPKLLSTEADAEFADSASSTSTAIMFTDRELNYVKEIICSVDIMFTDFATGRSREMVNPGLFDLLEKRKRPLESETRLRRKVLFDCVSECLDLRFKRFAGGGCIMWEKAAALARDVDRLAGEVYREITGWENSADSMVDELVDKDMSGQFGKWVDFPVDENSLGVEVEAGIFDSLIDELVDDVFLTNLCF